MRSKKFLIAFITTIFLIILISVFYSNRVFLEGFHWGDDALFREIPMASLFIKTIKMGSFPLWNPYKACGLPFFEVPNISYHPGVILYFLFPIAKATNYIFLIHLFISAIFMFLLCSEFNFSRLISFFCASSWILSSIFHFYLRQGYLPYVISASSLPVLVYLTLKAINTKYPKRITFFIFASMLAALTITGGHPPATAIVFYCTFIFVSLSVKNRRDLKNLLYIFLLALLLSIVYWGPVLVHVYKFDVWKLISRSNVHYSYSLSELKNFLVPTTLQRGYVGKLVLFIGTIGFFLRGRFLKNTRLLALVSFILMIHYAANFIPIANITYHTFEWHIGLIFSLIISAGFGLHKLNLFLLQKKHIFKIISLSVLSICITFQLVDLYRYNRKFYPQRFEFGLRDYFPAQPFIDFFKKDPSLFRVSNVCVKSEALRKHQGMLHGINLFQSSSKGLCLNKITGIYSLKQSIYWHYLEEGMSQAMVSLCNIKYIVTHLKYNSDDFFKHLTWEGRVDSLYPLLPNGDKEAFEFSKRKLILHLYENKQYFPRAFLLENSNKNEIKDFLLDYNIPTILRGHIPEGQMGLLSNYKNVDIKWHPNTYEISLDCNSDSFLFLGEMFYPGWKAKLDDKTTEISTPFNFFMGIFVPPGKHIVKFYFAPKYFYCFLAISFFTFIFLISKLIKIQLTAYEHKKDTVNC